MSRLMRGVLAVVVAAVLCASATAGPILFEDDFAVFDTATVWEPAVLPDCTGPCDSATPGILDGRTVVTLHSDLAPFERHGYQTQQTFSGSLPFARAEVTFQPITGSIDGMMDLWLYGVDTDNFVHIEIFGSLWGADRFVYSECNLGGSFEARASDTPGNDDDWAYDTWYRLVINAGQTQTTAALQADDGTPIWTTTYTGGMPELGNFKVAMAQVMGTPYDQCDAAVDHLVLTSEGDTAVPEPATLALVALGAVAALLKRRH